MNHASIIDDERVAGTQQAGKIAHDTVFQRHPAGGNHQHARRVTRDRRAQCDDVLRKLEVEKVDAHMNP